MNEPVFYIVTDDPVCALLDLFGLRPSQRPSWLIVLSDPIDIMALPDGAKCRGQWYSGRDGTGPEKAWRDRRGRGKLAFIDEAEEAWMLDWIAQRSARLEPATPAVPIVRPETQLQNMTLSQRWI